MGRKGFYVVLIFMLLWLTGCKKTPSYTRLFLISFDAGRFDFMPEECGNTGKYATSMPNLARLCSCSTIYRYGYSPLPATTSAVTTMYTGYFPHHHRVFLKGPIALSPGIPTLAEVLRVKGFRTYVIAGNSGFLHRTTLIARGFSSIGHENSDIKFHDPIRLMKKAINDIDTICDGPCFVHIHFLQPHAPYGAPARYFLQPIKAKKSFMDTRRLKQLLKQKEKNAQTIDMIQRKVVLHYQAGLRWADDALGQFLQFLESKTWRDETFIVLTSDHGEAFGEHELWGHLKSVYDEMVRVPFIVRTRECTHEVKDELASLEDIYATFLHASGTRGVPVSFSSVSHFHDSRRKQNKERKFLLIAGKGKGLPLAVVLKVRGHFYKYIYSMNTHLSTLFELSKDTHETTNIIFQKYDIAHLAHALMNAFLYNLHPPTSLHIGKRDMSSFLESRKEALKELQALGYTDVQLGFKTSSFSLSPEDFPIDKVQAKMEFLGAREVQDKILLNFLIVNIGKIAWPHSDVKGMPRLHLQCSSVDKPEWSVSTSLTQDIYPGDSVTLQLKIPSQHLRKNRKIVCRFGPLKPRVFTLKRQLPPKNRTKE